MFAMGRVAEGWSADEVLRSVSDFFMKKDDVHDTLRRLASRLGEEKIAYAIVGGMALALHGFARTTADVDILTTPEGLDRIHERLVGRGYLPAFSGARRRLRDTSTGVFVELLITRRSGRSSTGGGSSLRCATRLPSELDPPPRRGTFSRRGCRSE